MLIIDTREKKELVWDALASLNDANIPEFEMRALPLGDFLLDNGGKQLLIERKAMADFCSTYIDLIDRLDNMRLTHSRIGLLIEGDYRVKDGQIMLQGKNSKWYPSLLYKTYVNFIASQQDQGTYFYRSLDTIDTYRQLSYLHDYLPRMGFHPNHKAKSAIEWIAQLPGIGLTRAEKIKKQYSNPIEAFNEWWKWMNTKAINEMMEKW